MRGLWLAAAASAFAALQVASTWHESMTPHFEVYYEGVLPPSGYTLGLEKIHGRLRMDLYSLAPWMDKERIQVFVFATRASYRASALKPPPWSNGISIPERRIVAVYSEQERSELDRITTHEMTHVLFETFFHDKHRDPPPWLTEGVAMTMESAQLWLESDESKNPWHEALTGGGRVRVMPMAMFLRHEPEQERSSRAVSDWYLQAYGIVQFLLKAHSKLQFQLFCTKIRDGEDVRRALWDVYRFKNLADFDRAWLRWLRTGGKAGIEATEIEPPDIRPSNIRSGFRR